MYQKTIVLGNVGGDGQMRYTPDGVAVTTFNVATNRKWTDKEGVQQKKTTWFRVTTWNKLAEICNQYIHKGDLVFVEGELDSDNETGSPRIWTTQNGETRASYELRANVVRFASTREVAQETSESEGEVPF